MVLVAMSIILITVQALLENLLFVTSCWTSLRSAEHSVMVSGPHRCIKDTSALSVQCLFKQVPDCNHFNRERFVITVRWHRHLVSRAWTQKLLRITVLA